MRIGVTDRLPVATLFCVQAFNSSQMGVYWPNFGTCIVVGVLIFSLVFLRVSL